MQHRPGCGGSPALLAAAAAAAAAHRCTSLCAPPALVCREFVEQILPHFQRDNPQLAVETVVQRGKHPGLLAEYRECRCHRTAAVLMLDIHHLCYLVLLRPLA